jgi:hypothetical protein
MKKTNLFLLLEDFGANKRRLFENSIEFERVHRGMTTQCQARVQCFFADSCRQVSYELLDLVDPSAGSLLDEREGSFYPEDAPLFYATAPNDQAYGLSNEPTVYTQAILRALRGAGSRRTQAGWAVTTGHLQEGIRTSMERLGRQVHVPPQRPLTGGQLSGGSVLSVLKEEPVVPVTIALRPPEAARRAELSLALAADPTVRIERRRERGDWELELRAGDYDGQAHFPKGDYRDGHWRVKPYPPQLYEPWEV